MFQFDKFKLKVVEFPPAPLNIALISVTLDTFQFSNPFNSKVVASEPAPSNIELIFVIFDVSKFVKSPFFILNKDSNQHAVDIGVIFRPISTLSIEFRSYFHNCVS